MKKYISYSIIFVMLVGLTAFVCTPVAFAAGYGGGNSDNAPGMHAYGQGHQHGFHFWWGGRGFEDFDELTEYIRERLEVMFGNRHTGSGTSDRFDVTTRSATDIDEDSAVLRGSLELDDQDYAHVWFEYGEERDDLDNDTSREKKSSDGSFSERVDDLDADERYYYRAAAESDDDDTEYGSIYSFTTDDDADDDPTAETRQADNIDDNDATLEGTVDMRDFNNGVVFFVWGTDESQIEDVADDYDTYNDIVEDGEDLQKKRVDVDLDHERTYELDIDDLDDDTRYYFAIGVAYEDEDNDEQLILGDVESFRTDE